MSSKECHKWCELRSRDESWHSIQPEMFADAAHIVVRYENRTVYKLDFQDKGTVYAKWFTPQNAGMKSLLRASLKRIFRGPLSQVVFNIHEMMRHSGFCCAEPVLAAWNWRNMSELFVCREIAVPSVQKLLCALQPDEANAMLVRLADEMKRLHKAGFVLGDAIPGNLLFEQGTGKVHYLDNDRTRHYPFVFKHACLRNVIQFCAHIPPEAVCQEAAERFISRYAENFLSKGELSRLREAVVRRSAVIAEERKIKRSLQ